MVMLAGFTKTIPDAKLKISFYTMFCGHHSACIPHLVCTNVLVYARACVSACLRDRSGDNNYVQGYTKFIQVYVCFCDCKPVYTPLICLTLLKSLVALV